jgi:hypothetical protein
MSLTDREYELLDALTSRNGPLLHVSQAAACHQCLIRLEIHQVVFREPDDGCGAETGHCPRCGMSTLLPGACISLDGGLVSSTLSMNILRAMGARWGGKEEELAEEV